jgi:glycine hydroxymethyltransferase
MIAEKKIMTLKVMTLEDRELEDLLIQEQKNQVETLRLIPSENYVSANVRHCLHSVLVNRYSEGYPGQRYYEGTEIIDQIENLAIERAKKIFAADHANVQPYSGSPANQAVYFALLKPGSTILGMSLPDGGHLTHGLPANFSGKLYHAVSYHVSPQTGYLEMDAVRKAALEHRPAIIICGGSAYPRQLDFKAFREIADEIGAKLMVDMAHFAGLVAAKAHPSPVPYADVVTLTTHKVLRGPRGAIILCRSKYANDIDRAVFPGLQGGPHNHSIAGIATALYEASTSAFQQYGLSVVANARLLAEDLMSEGFDLVTGGTDTHLMLIDLRRRKLPGKVLSKALSQAGIITNANTVPGETGTPKNPSGLRLGTPAITTRGMGPTEMHFIAKQITAVAAAPEDKTLLQKVKAEVISLCSHFPVEPHL